MAPKDIALVVAGVATVVVFLVAAAVLTGYIIVDDPSEAASEVVSGDVETPPVETGGWTIDEERSDLDTVVFHGEVEIDNTMNAVGGSVDVIEYEAYASGRPDEGFEKVGEGEIQDLVVPPGEVAREETSFESDTTEFVSAVGATGLDAVVTGEAYLRVDGVARFNFGPFSFEVEFSQTDRLA